MHPRERALSPQQKRATVPDERNIESNRSGYEVVQLERSGSPGMLTDDSSSDSRGGLSSFKPRTSSDLLIMNVDIINVPIFLSSPFRFHTRQRGDIQQRQLYMKQVRGSGRGLGAQMWMTILRFAFCRSGIVNTLMQNSFLMATNCVSYMRLSLLCLTVTTFKTQHVVLSAKLYGLKVMTHQWFVEGDNFFVVAGGRCRWQGELGRCKCCAYEQK